jgi:hypothetical protein
LRLQLILLGPSGQLVERTTPFRHEIRSEKALDSEVRGKPIMAEQAQVMEK